MNAVVQEEKTPEPSRVRSFTKNLLNFVYTFILPLFLIVGAVLFFAILLGQAEKPPKIEEAQRVKDVSHSADMTAGSISYIKDHRAGLCYAAYDTNHAADYYQPPTFRTIGNVPCENVATLLVNPDPPPSK
jgi:hypothetical protein